MYVVIGNVCKYVCVYIYIYLGFQFSMVFAIYEVGKTQTIPIILCVCLYKCGSAYLPPYILTANCISNLQQNGVLYLAVE